MTRDTHDFRDARQEGIDEWVRDVFEHGQRYRRADRSWLVETAQRWCVLGVARRLEGTGDVGLRETRTTPDGLTESEVQARLEVFGRNTVAYERTIAWSLMLLNNLRNPFILVFLCWGRSRM
jgi:magnesium-transporting ATPase (P-type)